MASIGWSLTALDDLKAIEDYVASDSPLQAVRLVDRLVEAVEQLGPFPLCGRVVPEFERDELRGIIVSVYRIVYLVRDASVIIVRVIHGARDMKQISFD